MLEPSVWNIVEYLDLVVLGIRDVLGWELYARTCDRVYMPDLGMWVICKILECGLDVRSWNVGYMSDLGMWFICKIWECGLCVRSWNVG